MTAFLPLQLLVAMGLFLLIRVVMRAAGKPVRSTALSWILFGGCLLFPKISVGGLSLVQWLAGFSPGCSIPLLAVLSHGAVRGLGGPSLFRPADLRSVWILGVGLGLVLYPASMGWGNWDPYLEGWGRSWIFPTFGVLASVLILAGFRSGYVFLAAIIAWRLGALESTNYWDYLMDPQFFLVATVGLILGLWSRLTERRGIPGVLEERGRFSGGR